MPTFLLGSMLGPVENEKILMGSCRKEGTERIQIDFKSSLQKLALAEAGSTKLLENLCKPR